MTDKPNDPITAMYRRPGFMIRRAHQIAVGLFLEETGDLGITNTQYGILTVLRQRPGIDQISIAKLLGLDRSTTGMVLSKLESAGLIGRHVGATDKRRHAIKLTAAGARMQKRLGKSADRAQMRELGAFTPREAEQFLDLLDKFIHAFNGSTRVPLDFNGAAKRAKSGAKKAKPRPR
jgi:DNA-binding MarR family transcriptional regulator